MAIPAQIEEAGKASAANREPRRKLRLDAQGVTEAGGRANVRVHNISATGLLLETQVTLAIGEGIEIDLPHAGATAAKVVWSSGALFGCEFDDPISAAALSAAQLRSAVDTKVEIDQLRDLEPAPFGDESFGARLQRLRKARGLSLSQVAARLGVSKPTVWAWERGKARPVESRIDGLAQVLGLESADLFPKRHGSGLQDVLTRSREQIAGAAGISPAKVRIYIEL